MQKGNYQIKPEWNYRITDSCCGPEDDREEGMKGSKITHKIRTIITEETGTTMEVKTTERNEMTGYSNNKIQEENQEAIKIKRTES